MAEGVSCGSPVYVDWHHAVVWMSDEDKPSPESVGEGLREALRSSTAMIEADIRLCPNRKMPVMAHDLHDAVVGPLFSDWLEVVIAHNTRCLEDATLTHKGLKLDFKEMAAVAPVVLHLEQVGVGKRDGSAGLRGREMVEVWLNADIVQGPGGAPPSIPPDEFLHACSKFQGQNVRLSLGYTTTSYAEDEDPHLDEEMIAKMLACCLSAQNVFKSNGHSINVSITLALCEKFFPKNAERILGLLRDMREGGVRDPSITIWALRRGISLAHAACMRGLLPREATHFDVWLPHAEHDEQKQKLRTLLRQ